MTEEVQAHKTSISMVRAALAELNAATDMQLKVTVSCSSKCSLEGWRVIIVDDEDVAVKEVGLAEFDGTVNETDEFVVNAPIEPGEHTWKAVFPAQENEGILHEESSTSFSFTVKPHATSIAVWDVPSPVAFCDEFMIKVGVKCSAECNLAGKEIEVYDHEEARVATGTLCDVPWSTTGALYWAEVELVAPATEGYYRWTVEFQKPNLDLPHEEASCTFAFGASRRPEHVVTVEVVIHDTKAPIKNAHVLLRPDSGHPYRGYTDEGGVAKIGVPKGEYELYVSKVDHETFGTPVKVAGDVSMKAELLPAPPDLY